MPWLPGEAQKPPPHPEFQAKAVLRSRGHETERDPERQRDRETEGQEMLWGMGEYSREKERETQRCRKEKRDPERQKY